MTCSAVSSRGESTYSLCPTSGPTGTSATAPSLRSLQARWTAGRSGTQLTDPSRERSPEVRSKVDAAVAQAQLTGVVAVKLKHAGESAWSRLPESQLFAIAKILAAPPDDAPRPEYTPSRHVGYDFATRTATFSDAVRAHTFAVTLVPVAGAPPPSAAQLGAATVLLRTLQALPGVSTACSRLVCVTPAAVQGLLDKHGLSGLVGFTLSHSHEGDARGSSPFLSLRKLPKQAAASEAALRSFLETCIAGVAGTRAAGDEDTGSDVAAADAGASSALAACSLAVPPPKPRAQWASALATFGSAREASAFLSRLVPSPAFAQPHGAKARPKIFVKHTPPAAPGGGRGWKAKLTLHAPVAAGGGGGGAGGVAAAAAAIDDDDDEEDGGGGAAAAEEEQDDGVIVIDSDGDGGDGGGEAAPPASAAASSASCAPGAHRLHESHEMALLRFLLDADPFSGGSLRFRG